MIETLDYYLFVLWAIFINAWVFVYPATHTVILIYRIFNLNQNYLLLYEAQQFH